MESTFKQYNKILGWAVFLIALISYTLTLEPTVSFWDCGEYISTATKLEVGHPPGAPLFQMLGAFFSIFASSPLQIAHMINFMSGLFSALTILLMFWTIVILIKKVLWKDDKELTPDKMIIIFGSALTGSLAYAYTDSFWFSAVEGEVYATSSFLMALLLWSGLRWEREMDKPDGNRWLLLLSFTVGLSFGVHILALLVIPPVIFIYIFKHYQIGNFKRFALANIIAVLILAFIFKFLFPFTLRYFSAMELFFVNSLGMPFNSGTVIAAVLLIAAIVYALKYTRKKNLHAAHTLILSVVFIMIGFSTWIMLPIRANAGTTINENKPASARELLAYYNREQYGDANVFYDKYYSYAYKNELDKKKPYRDDHLKYEKDKKSGKYVIVNRDTYKNFLPNYSDKHKGFIPRMTSPDPTSVKYYKSITGIPQNSTRRPTFLENLHFMLSYQFGYMYGRYFMWNFTGRQNDVQGRLDIENGNWISGIPFIDRMLVGPQKHLPDFEKNNKAHNTYFFLPFILGLLGVFFHFKRDPEKFYIIFLFFAFTGLAVIFYTNPKPFEPRERDYALVGSFYAFAIWIGFGVTAIYAYLKDKINPKVVAWGAGIIGLLAAPVLLAVQNWDDHDRSGKYTARINALAYLESCDPNAILFTIGDNDTFPLWYMQETEGIRTDIKVINSSLFATDWYIDQMKKKTYKAPPIPSQLKHQDYKYGSLEVAYFMPMYDKMKDSVWDVKKFVNWIQSKKKHTYLDKDKVYPTNKLRLYVDKEAVLKNGIVAPEDADKILPYIDFTISDRAIGKQNIMMLDILANFHWERPIYFSGGSFDDAEYIWLKDYLQLEGLTYKLVPIRTPVQDDDIQMGRVNTGIMYKHIRKWDWKNIDGDNIYLDPESRRNAINFRRNFYALADAYFKEGKNDKAEEILDMQMKHFPVRNYGNSPMLLDYVRMYYKLGKKDKARELAEKLLRDFQQHMTYYSEFSEDKFPLVYDGFELNAFMYRDLVTDIFKTYESEDYTNRKLDEYIKYIEMFEHYLKE